MSGLLQKLNKRPRRNTRENAGSRVVLPERGAANSGTATPGTAAIPLQPDISITQELERTGAGALPWWVHTPPATNRWVDTVVPLALELVERATLPRAGEEEALRKVLRSAVSTAAGAFSTEHTLSLREVEDATTAVGNLLFGRGPLEPLFADLLVTDIFVRAHNSVQCLRRGQILDAPFRFHTPEEYSQFLNELLARSGLTLSAEHPVAQGILPDAQRAKISVLHPSLLASPEPSLAIRIPRLPQVTLYELIRTKVLPASLAAWLTELMAFERCAILLTGKGGTGKTTLATALLGAAPSSARIITIEEVAELNPTSHHLEKLLLQRPAPAGASARDLVEVALQRLPHWIALGDLPYGQSPALLRALEGESSCLVTAQAICERTALQMILDDLRAELPRTPGEELASRLYAGVDLAIVMGSAEGRPYIEALRERSADDPRSFTDIVRFAGETNGKRVWKLLNPESSWVRALRERGHELRLGPGLLPAT